MERMNLMMTQEQVNEIEQLLPEVERELENNEDFDRDDLRPAKDGIKWFVQEWLPDYVKRSQNH